MLAIVIYCLRLFNFYCCHGDGSDGRHVYSMYYGHMHIVSVEMLVMGGMCVQSITAIHTIIRLLCW